MKRFWVMSLLLAAVGIVIQPVSVAASGTWTSTGSMSIPRTGTATALLPTGKVLVAGGLNFTGGTLNVQSSAELYDPAVGSWSLTSPMPSPRAEATATVLQNGDVLVAGGSNGAVLATAVLYHPSTGTWSTTTGSMTTARHGHTATMLPSGMVLVTGGTTQLAAELYNPGTGLWTATGTMAVARETAAAALLSNGKVLVAGGNNPGTCAGATTEAEIYDPGAGTWSSAGSMFAARNKETATVLPSGKVLIAGGGIECTSAAGIAEAELYDPATNSWSLTGSMATARYAHAATLLNSGQVLVVGGNNADGSQQLASAELYDPVNGTWSGAGSMATPRAYAPTTLLNTGAALVEGGLNSSGQLSSAEVFQVSDLTMSLSVTPSTATNGQTVTFNGSLTNTASVSRSVTLTSTLTYVPSGGSARTLASSTNMFTMSAGQTFSTSNRFSITRSTPRGLYTLTEVASDSAGSVQRSATLTVT